MAEVSTAEAVEITGLTGEQVEQVSRALHLARRETEELMRAALDSLMEQNKVELEAARRETARAFLQKVEAYIENGWDIEDLLNDLKEREALEDGDGCD